jgi:hypothetical protein
LRSSPAREGLALGLALSCAALPCAVPALCRSCCALLVLCCAVLCPGFCLWLCFLHAAVPRRLVSLLCFACPVSFCVSLRAVVAWVGLSGAAAGLARVPFLRRAPVAPVSVGGWSGRVLLFFAGVPPCVVGSVGSWGRVPRSFLLRFPHCKKKKKKKKKLPGGLPSAHHRPAPLQVVVTLPPGSRFRNGG